MPTELQNKTTSVIIAFLKEIGLKVEFGSVNDDTFLPGIEVVAGGLIVDESRLLFPGDLLHEAGHLAIVPATTRANLSGKVEISEANPDVIEATAMCWSYAACVQLGIEPSVVFHAHGYHGRSQNLLFGFELGVFPGVQGLVSVGMTINAAGSERSGLAPFPAMQKWLRD